MCQSRAMVALSGINVDLEYADYRATVVEVGAGLRTLTKAGADLVAGYGEDEMCSGGRGQILLPWPNRIADGRYEFALKKWQLPLTEPGRRNASHGLTRWANWTLAEQTPSRARWTYVLHPQPGYRGLLELSVDYQLSDLGLRVETTATNIGRRAAPYGAGAHPYLTVGRPIDDCELTLPAATRCPSTVRGLPGAPEPVRAGGFDFRRPRVIGAAVFDDVFGDLDHAEGAATAELRDPDSGRSATIWVDDAYRWVQVFSGEGQGALARQALAVEPMTCPANAFTSTVDLVILKPGNTHRAIYGIR